MRRLIQMVFVLLVVCVGGDARAQTTCARQLAAQQALGQVCTVRIVPQRNRWGFVEHVCHLTCTPSPRQATTTWVPPRSQSPPAVYVPAERIPHDRTLVDIRLLTDAAWAEKERELAELRARVEAREAGAERMPQPTASAAAVPLRTSSSIPVPRNIAIEAREVWREMCEAKKDEPVLPWDGKVQKCLALDDIARRGGQ